MNIKIKQILGVTLIAVCMIQAVPTMALSEIRVRVNGSQVYFPDGKPFIDENSRVLVPVRFVSQQLGAKVNWDAKNKKVTVIDGDKNATLTINSKQVTVNGASKTLDTAAVVKNERTYVPLRFIGEAFGAGVRWDSKVRIVYIDNGKPALPETEVVQMGLFTMPTDRFEYVIEDSLGIGGRSEKYVTYDVTDIGTPQQNHALFINYNNKIPYAEMYDETEEYLSQVVSPTKAKEIMDFCRKKKDIYDFIGVKKIYENGIYVQAISVKEGVNIVVTKNKNELVRDKDVKPLSFENVIK